MRESLRLFFKPETQAQGAELVADGFVLLAQTSDTQIRSFIKKSPPIHVTFQTASIETTSFIANCSCPSSTKGKLCKHIWATLLKVEADYPDFLDVKTEIEKGTGPEKSTRATASFQPSPARQEFEAARKAKQADYRKQQYQIQKQRQKERRKTDLEQDRKSDPGAKISKLAARRPEGVEMALKYFSENGFPLSYPTDPEELLKVKRILSRVFHPDKGGTHEEMLELTRQLKTLSE